STFNEIGILYLFTVSGLHIYALLLVIKKIFFFFSLSDKTQYWLTGLIYIIILYLNAFSMSIVRIFLVYVIQKVFKRIKIELTQLDYIHIVFFMMLLFKIEWIYHVGFLMLFIILNFIFLMSHVLSTYKGYLRRLSFSVLVILCILPFQLVISPFFMIFLPVIIAFITGPVYFLSILTLLIPELDRVFILWIQLFESFVSLLGQRNISINLPALSVYGVVVYYIFLIILLRSQSVKSFLKRSLLIVLLFTLSIFDIKITQDIHLYMIDVGQGDSILIESPECNIVIDSYQNVLPLINDLGIYQLDMLILTHSDNDHVMEAQSIIDHIDIKKVLINPY
ncbi:MAG: hypothetical protein CVV61_09400, partial [Tenericutes bacterium HGW-Tenericutes-6]